MRGLVLVVLVGAATGGAGSGRRELQTTDEQCGASTLDGSKAYYYDISSLSCEECDIAGRTSISASGTHCACSQTDPCDTCTGAGEVASQDGSTCMECGDGTTGATAATECACTDATHILVEYNSAGKRLPKKKCQACPAFSYRNPSNPYECQSCQNKFDSAKTQCTGCSGECDCPEDSTPHKKCPAAQCTSVKDGVFLGECVGSSWLSGKVTPPLPSNSDRIKFYNVEDGESEAGEKVVNSYTFKQLFWPSVTKCLRVQQAFLPGFAGPMFAQLERTEACQALANLCALEDYDFTSDRRGVCLLFSPGGQLTGATMRAQLLQVGNAEWYEHLPWVYRDKSVRTDKTAVALKVGFEADSSEGIVSQLQFKLAVYEVGRRALIRLVPRAIPVVPRESICI